MAFFIHGSDEELTSRFPLLVAFLPLVPALGGNIGIQSATVTVRSIATGDLDIGRIWSRTLKELITGILLAISLSLNVWPRSCSDVLLYWWPLSTGWRHYH